METMTDCCENCMYLRDQIDSWYCGMVRDFITDPEKEKCGYFENNKEGN